MKVVNAMIPVSKIPIGMRVATRGDYPFIDRLQDMHSKAVGFMRRAALEGKIERGEVLIAEDDVRLPIGYCISSSRYLKRDELGVVYQMNVVPGKQRSLVGATLLKAVFDSAPLGCRLFCCWCAQDIAANRFWESMGFIPLAFRTGAVGKTGGRQGGRPQARTHIFWQRRIRAGDCATPYWYPSKTDGGMMREDRLVLPIPPGVHWASEMPILLPTAGVPEAQNALPAPAGEARTSAPAEVKAATSMAPKPQAKRQMRFGPPSDAPEAVVEKVKLGAQRKRAKREKVKADPVLVAKARELRDRYLEQFNAGEVLPCGKYEVATVGKGQLPVGNGQLSEVNRVEPSLIEAA